MAVKALESHDPLLPALQFSTQNILYRRMYYQCLLKWDGLIVAHVEPFASNGKTSFYQCLLAGIMVPTGWRAAAYHLALKGKDLLAISDEVKFGC